jgi:hypothetical protein
MQPNVPVFNIHIDAIPMESVLWLVFAAVVLGFGIYSVILLWHWKEYSTGRFTTVANMFVYLGVGVGLLVVMALSTVWLGIVSY